MYGFLRINTKGMLDNGAYYHSMFLRGEKQLSLRMVRHKIKDHHAAEPVEHLVDPDFYQDATKDQECKMGSSRYSKREIVLQEAPFDMEAAASIGSMSQILSLQRRASILSSTSTNDPYRPVPISSNSNEWLEPSSSDRLSWIHQASHILHPSLEATRSFEGNWNYQDLLGATNHPAIHSTLLQQKTHHHPIYCGPGCRPQTCSSSFHEGDELFFEGKRFFFADEPASDSRVRLLPGNLRRLSSVARQA